MSEEEILKLVEAVVIEIDYDLWKEMFLYFEEDHNYEGSKIKKQRDFLLLRCKNIR